MDDNLEVTGYKKFKYLGFIINKEANIEDEIDNRLEHKRTCIKQTQFYGTEILQKSKKRIHKTMVQSPLLRVGGLDSIHRHVGVFVRLLEKSKDSLQTPVATQVSPPL